MNGTRMMTALAAAALIAVAPAGAEEKTGGTVIEEGVLDKIVLKEASMPSGVGVVIRRFPADKADLGTAEKGDNQRRVDAAKLMQNEAPRLFEETLLNALSTGAAFKFAKASQDEAPTDAIVVEGRFTMINPGSRAKRYWGGFGAGKSGIAVEGTVKTSSGKVLAEFEHKRHSGFGVGGGDYVKFLTDDTRDVARDVAIFLKRWATGGDLSRDADD